MSDVAPAQRPRRRAPTALARASLGLVPLAMSTACVIADPPQFTPPKHTRPFLVDATAEPDPAAVLTVDSTSVVTFSADVISQDDQAGSASGAGGGAAGNFQEVFGFLYIDLGFNGPDPLRPYSFAIQTSHALAGGTIDQTTGRQMSATWTPGSPPIAPGCHTATLMVSHIFDDIPCPVCDDDFSAITWQVVMCSDASGPDCQSLPIHGPGSCDGLTNSCAKVHEAMTLADAGVAVCPESTTDGGAL
jgi:hypothetical protein